MGLFEQFPYTNFHELNLDWIITTVRDLEGRIDGLQETILKLANAYTDSEVAKVRADFTALEAEFAAFELDVNKQFAEYTAKQDGKFKDFHDLINAQIVIMRGEIKAARDEFDGFLRQAYEYTDVQITAAATQIPECVDRAIPSAQVYNLIEGKTQGLQSMLDYLCGLHSDQTATVQEVIDAAKTCEEIYELGKTCAEWAQDGKGILGIASKGIRWLWANQDVPSEASMSQALIELDAAPVNDYPLIMVVWSLGGASADTFIATTLIGTNTGGVQYAFWQPAEGAVAVATRTLHLTQDRTSFWVSDCTINGNNTPTTLIPVMLFELGGITL